MWSLSFLFFFFFFFNDPATPEIYPLSLHDALPISPDASCRRCSWHTKPSHRDRSEEHTSELQSRGLISYAVFCLKKKKQDNNHYHRTNSEFRHKLIVLA